jgi:hypothetical protein
LKPPAELKKISMLKETREFNFRLSPGMGRGLLTPSTESGTSVVENEFELSSSLAASAGTQPIAALWTIFCGAASAALLICVAWWNGYPTVFSDTGGYLVTGAFHEALAPFRAPGYAAFTNVMSFSRSAWYIVVAQAILVVYVLRECCEYLIGGDRKFVDQCLLGVVLLLTAFSSLPWFTSLLMPDIFVAVVFLCAFLLGFHGELPVARKIVLAAILAIAVAAHTSLFPTASAFFAGMFVLRFVFRHSAISADSLPSARSALAWLLVPVLTAGIWTARQNQEMRLGFTLSPSGNSFLLGRLFGDGLASRFLRANCPQGHFVSCRYLSHLPQNEVDFLFNHPLLRELNDRRREIQSIVRGTISAYPGRFALDSFKQTIRQMAAVHTGDEIRSYSAQGWNTDAIERVFPGELQTFENTRQIHNRLLKLANAASKLDTPWYWLSLAACIVLARSRRFPRIDSFFLAAILFLLINAAVCGALAGVYNRYESRVAWLIPFCVFVYGFRWMRERKRLSAREHLISV